MAEAFIEVPIIDLRDLFDTDECYVVLYNYYNSEVVRGRYHQSKMVWNSLPTVEQLIRAFHVSSQRNRNRWGSPFWRLQKAVCIFAEEYCSVANDMPLVSF